MTNFGISDEVKKMGIPGTYFVMEDIINKYNIEILNDWPAHISELRKIATPQLLESDPTLKGFRDLHEAIGVSNRKYPSSSENLISNFIRTGNLPSINPIVDIYNLISIKSKLAIGAHDLGQIQGNISLKLTTGQEKYTPIGEKQLRPARAGVYAYVDIGTNEIICLLETRQCEKTKVSEQTTKCFFIVQGNNSVTQKYTQQIAEELVDITRKYCGGVVSYFY